MRRLVGSSLFAFVVMLTLSFTGFSQQFSPEYFPYDETTHGIQVDLNGDGIPDFIGQSSYQVVELLSTGPGSFAPQTITLPGNATGIPIASGDFNGDGKADVIFYAPLAIAYGDGKGGFTSYQTLAFSNPSGYAQAQVADFNGDGKQDLAVAYETGGSGATFEVIIFLNNGHGFGNYSVTYQQPVPSGSTPGFEYTTPLDLVLGDFNADGLADLVLRTTESDPVNPGEPDVRITALYGEGRGFFTASEVDTSNTFYEISAADMNNDGTSDLVAANYDSMEIFYGQANRTSFVAGSLSATQPIGLNPMLADFNGDGRKDIVYAASPFKNNSDIGESTLLQTAAGTFNQLGFESIDTYYGGHGEVPFAQSFVGDYNRDGKPDVMLVSETENEHPNSAGVLLNTRAKPNGTCQTPASPSAISVCSPTPNQTVSNPVQFAFSATSFYPVRKMEVWIDGTKRSETYEVFANEGFANVNLKLTPGTHKVSLFEGGFDGTVQHTSYSITVQ
jgi:FG-GAP-like repeat